ncbi:hypothetical protein LXL04_037730 [Taraxacum kok-saghyz]
MRSTSEQSHSRLASHKYIGGSCGDSVMDSLTVSSTYEVAKINRGTIAYRVRSESRIAAQNRRSGKVIDGVPDLIGNANAVKWERRLRFNGNGDSSRNQRLEVWNPLLSH